MLRRILRPTGPLYLQKLCLSSTAAAPSTKTSVLLKNIPPSVNEEVLIKALADLNCRKVFLEPGCAVHLLCEAEADYASRCIEEKMSLSANVVSTTTPSILLQNLPENITVELLESSFKQFKAIRTQILGDSSLQVSFQSSKDAISFARSIENQNIQNMKPKTSISKSPSESYVVTISSPISSSNYLIELEAVVQDMISKKNIDTKVVSTAAKAKTFVVRMSSGSDISALTAAINTMGKDETQKPTIIQTQNLPRPALFLRNVKTLSPDVFNGLKNPDGPLHKAERVERCYRGKDVPADLAVCYFSSEIDAMCAMNELRTTVVDGVRLSVSYKEVSEPAVIVKNLPASATILTVQNLFKVLRPSNIEMLPTDTSNGPYNGMKSARVLLSGPKDVQIAINTYNSKIITNEGNQISFSNVLQDAVKEELLLQNLKENNDNNIDNDNSISNTSLLAQESVDIEGNGDGEGGSSNSKGKKGMIGGGVNRLKKGTIKALKKKSWKEGLVVEEDSIYDLAAGLTVKSVSQQTNRTAFISFDTIALATAAHSAFQRNTIKPSLPLIPATINGTVTSRLSIVPSFVVQVSGLEPNRPATDVLAVLNNEVEDGVEDAENVQLIRPVRVDRGGLLKFKRHKEVVPGLKKLKSIQLGEGDMTQKLSFSRYRPLEGLADSEYDTEGPEEQFDQFSLRTLLKDYLHTDPATRYQLAKNAFERALNDSLAQNNPQWLLDASATPAMKLETTALLSQATTDENGNKQLSKECMNRLFEMFIQRDDMLAFASDFKEMEAMFGLANPEDSFDWSKFSIHDAQELNRIYEEVQEADRTGIAHGLDQSQSVYREWKMTDRDIKKIAEEEMLKGNSEEAERRRLLSATDQVAPSLNPTDDEEALSSIVVKDILGKDEVTVNLDSKDEIASLVDNSGRVWSGVILDSDITQKTMPGNRVSSKRVLVCVGNMRGAGGFGMGKGKTAALALNAAFRDALRNLTFIDLYDNYGLAHNLHGKHNSCHAYIIATPRERVMVGSPFAAAILNRMGIGSASVKLIGRRDPYAMVKAIFNALEKHQNLDEYAKARGMRYLTLRWARDNNI
eukprot:gene2521-4903_t